MNDYAPKLRETTDQTAYLRAHSGLPGPRGNLELMQAAVDIGDESHFRNWIVLGSGSEPTDEFIAMCGVVGLGRLAAEIILEANPGDPPSHLLSLVEELRGFATDPRWRVREAVAMALQRVGDASPSALVEIASAWAEDGFYVQRAAVAAVSEPRLLRVREVAESAVRVVELATTLLASSFERKSDGFRVLRQALGYCWSVVVVAAPEYGRPLFEHWATSDDGDVKWIVRENLKKARLTKLDADWVERLKAGVR
jgi:hypothetical protein